MQLPSGTLLQNGKYRIVRFINNGGFGCTYEGQQTLIGQRVAIKEFFVNDFCNREGNKTVSVWTKSKAEDFQKLKKGFIKEASVLYQMRNQHIVRVTDIFEENGTAYYVMEYIDGASLADIVSRKGKLTEHEALGYIRQVCEALKYVHSQNRMHMDVKPGNIMVNIDGKVILIDFGTSKYYDVDTGEQTSTLLGIYTKGYAPLEQISRTVKTFNPATDIYSVGATLYKLLSGITPPDSIALVSGGEELKPLPSTISSSTRNAVAQSMQLFSNKRPQSIAEFERLLNNTARIEENTVYDSQTTQSYRKYTSTSTTTTNTSNVGYNSRSKGNTINASQNTPAKKGGLFGRISNLFDGLGSKNASSKINGHEYVDLGLPSGLKWATCNVGASKPEQYGSYFAWGETRTKSSYGEGNSETYGKDNQWLRSNGYIGVNGNLTLSHDAARQNWGGPWRMPTLNEINELVNNTTTEWTILNGVRGRLIKSKRNGNTMFLPAGGCHYRSTPNGVGACGDYWGSTSDESDSGRAYYLCLYSDNFRSDYGFRYFGQSVRPVSE